MSYQPSDKLKAYVKNGDIKILGITGKMFSGKDTVAEFIHFAFRNSRITSFAYPMKQMMIDYFGFTHDDLYTVEGKKRYNEFWGMTNRDALQKIGTECFRNNFHIDTWLKTMEVNIIHDPTKLIIIPDVRFPNEAELIKALGGSILKIVRDDVSRDPNQIAHASESLIDQIPHDMLLVNDKDRTSLFETTLWLLEEDGILTRYMLNPHIPNTIDDTVLEDEYFTAIEEHTGDHFRNRPI